MDKRISLSNGVWQIDIKHFKTHRSRTGVAIGVMMSDEDEARGILPIAFEKAVNAVKKAIDKNQGVKNVCKQKNC